MSNDTVEEYVGGSYVEMVLERDRENTALQKMKTEPWRKFGHQIFCIQIFMNHL